MWAWVGGQNISAVGSSFPMAPGESGHPGCRRGAVSIEIEGSWYIFGGLFRAVGKFLLSRYD